MTGAVYEVCRFCLYLPSFLVSVYYSTSETSSGVPLPHLPKGVENVLVTVGNLGGVFRRPEANGGRAAGAKEAIARSMAARSGG